MAEFSPTQDYLSFFTSYPQVPLMSLVALFFLSLFRLVPIVALVSFLGSRLPGSAKMGLAVSLAVLMLPHLMVLSTHVYDFNLMFIAYSLKELFIGLVIATLASLPFYMAEAAGILIDYVRGASSLQISDPLLRTQTSPIGVLYNYILVVLFIQIGGLFIFLNGLLDSYTVIPIDAFIPTTFFNLAQPFWKAMLDLVNKFVSLSIQMAAPSIVAVLMAEMFLGIANRLAPQVQIAFLGMAFKSLLGLGLLWAGWYFVLEQMGKESLKWVERIEFLIRSIKF